MSATYETAFLKLEQDEPDAAQLFSLLSFFDPEYVSTDILTNNADQIASENPLVQVLKYSLNFERSVSQLRQFSVQRFTRRPDESRALWIHDLVQEMYRDRMSTNLQAERLELAITLLHSCFPEELLGMADPATWNNYEKCMPHVIAGIVHAKKLNAQSVRFARLCRDAGWFLYHKGQYDGAIEMATISIPLLEDNYGEEDDEYIMAVNLLAAVHHTKGNFRMALKWYFKVLTHREKTLGLTDNTNNTKHNIALCYHEAGNFEESNRRFEEVVSFWETKYGPDHSSTLCSQMSMARNIRYQGNFDLAEQILQKCREGLLRECGSQHMWTLLSGSELASAIWRGDSSRYKEAEKLHREALIEKVKQLGEDHVHTWDSYADLGCMISKCDPSRKEEAEQLMMKALKQYAETLTINHSQTREFYGYLVEFYQETNQPEKLEILRETFGIPNTPSPLITPLAEQESLNTGKDDSQLDLGKERVRGGPKLDITPDTTSTMADDKVQLNDNTPSLEALFPDVKSLPEPRLSEEENIAVLVNNKPCP